jgi:glutamate---cysteine ligase / carboxylate-amine ligase
VRTIGVEEELLLVSTIDGNPAAIGDEVVAAARRSSSLTADDTQIEHEFKQEQTEIASTPCETLDQLRAELVELRAGVARVALARHAMSVAIATSPVKVRPHQTDDDRYRAMNLEFGLLARQQLTCGQHVHVAVDSREEGVAVLDRIRVWLPVLIALAANSPFWQGADTGYASYRTVLWGQWPTSGPTELFGSVDEYERQVDDLVATGAALDEGMVYFAARLSAHYPTVEIRVTDVCTDVDDAVLIAALSRALVDTAATEWQHGRPAPEVTTGLLRAAHWRAARFGLDGQLFDVAKAQQVDGWQLLDRLVAHVTPALASAGDEAAVTASLRRLRTRGTGADAQRSVAATGRAGLREVVIDAARRTVTTSQAP